MNGSEYIHFELWRITVSELWSTNRELERTDSKNSASSLSSSSLYVSCQYGW